MPSNRDQIREDLKAALAPRAAPADEAPAVAAPTRTKTRTPKSAKTPAADAARAPMAAAVEAPDRDVAPAAAGDGAAGGTGRAYYLFLALAGGAIRPR